MRLVLVLLRRGRLFLLFLALEFMALSWLLNERSFQRSIANQGLMQYSQNLLSLRGDVNDYLNLKVENQMLAEENARLQNLLERHFVYKSNVSSGRGDSAEVQRYRSLPARVVSASIFKRNNYLSLDRGSSSGVRENMGVIGPNGAVGIVNQVSKHFCTVLPLINPNLALSGQLSSSGHFGSVQWDARDYRFTYLSDIPRYAKVDSGGLITTDGRSMAFPSDIPIGHVVSQELQVDQNFLRLKLELSEDFSKLQQVYILRDLMRDELDSLIQQPQ